MTRRKARRPEISRGSAGRSASGVTAGSARRDLQMGLKAYGYVLLALLAISAVGAAVVWARPFEVLSGITRLRLAIKGFHSEFVMLNGHRIHYLEGGRGAPVVLVHGLSGSAEDWANLMPQLTAAGYHVYAIDMLGYGRSDRPRNASFSIAQEAGVVEAFLRSRPAAPVALGGWSMGGWVVGQVALDAPRSVSKLMFFDAAGMRFTPGFVASDFTPGTPEGLQRLYALLMPHPAKMPEFLMRDMLRRGRDSKWVIQRSVESMFTGVGLLDGRLGALRMPALIAWGKDDHMLPPSMGVAMHAEMPQSTLLLLDGCGHLAPGQCADRLGPRIVEFLNGKGLQPGATVEIAAKR